MKLDIIKQVGNNSSSAPRWCRILEFERRRKRRYNFIWQQNIKWVKKGKKRKWQKSKSKVKKTKKRMALVLIIIICFWAWKNHLGNVGSEILILSFRNKGSEMRFARKFPISGNYDTRRHTHTRICSMEAETVSHDSLIALELKKRIMIGFGLILSKSRIQKIELDSEICSLGWTQTHKHIHHITLGIGTG